MVQLKQLSVGTQFQLYSRYRNGNRRPRMFVKLVVTPATHVTLRNAVVGTRGDGTPIRFALGGAVVSIDRKAVVKHVDLMGKTLTVVKQSRGVTTVDVEGCEVMLAGTLNIRSQ